MKKFNIQIPTIQFGLIAVEIEGTVEDAVSAHNELIEAYRASQGVSEGMSPKEFNRCLDEYLTTNSLINGTELYAQMSKVQQQVFQEIKKSLKRIKARNVDEHAEQALSDIG